MFKESSQITQRSGGILVKKRESNLPFFMFAFLGIQGVMMKIIDLGVVLLSEIFKA